MAVTSIAPIPCIRPIARDELVRVVQRLLTFVDPLSGGCAYTRSMDPQGYDYVHCEASGYALSFLARLENQRIAGYEQVADRLASFLVSNQMPHGGFPHSTSTAPGFSRRNWEVHTFDTAVCASALLDHAAIRGSAQSIDAANKALDWLTEKAQRDDGSFHCVYDERAANWDGYARGAFWSSDYGCYLGKILISLLKGERYEAADRLAEHLLATRRRDGIWNATPRHTQTHTHALLYTLEGLYLYSLVRGATAARDAVRVAMVWLSELSLRHGGLPAWESEPKPVFRSDAQLQFLRLADLLEPSIVPQESREACLLRLTSLRTDDGFWRFDDGASAISSRLPSWSLVFEGCLHLRECSALERII
jgi:hypothetical protein